MVKRVSRSPWTTQKRRQILKVHIDSGIINENGIIVIYLMPVSKDRVAQIQ